MPLAWTYSNWGGREGERKDISGYEAGRFIRTSQCVWRDSSSRPIVDNPSVAGSKPYAVVGQPERFLFLGRRRGGTALPTYRRMI